MAIRFAHGRLLVGWRRRDWCEVWYAPIGQPDQEGGRVIGLYSSSTTQVLIRGPMEGEVFWIPYFDLALCESKRASERDLMQKQFLSDAHRYLNERDAGAVQRMELDFDVRFGRWRAFFDEAKKWKHNQLVQQERRKKRKRPNAVPGPANTSETAINLESTAEESGYESEEQKQEADWRNLLAKKSQKSGGSSGRMGTDAGPVAKRSRPNGPASQRSDSVALGSWSLEGDEFDLFNL